MKRTLDIVCASAGLIVLAPLLFALWVAVAVSSGIPAIFRQTRVGRGGHDFTLFKFRTMTLRRDTEQDSFEAGCTTRVTPIGRILRRTKLDELPQLWNVLTGDMSMVGPRPEVREWVEVYPSRWDLVLTVRPGVTDPASIEFRNEEEILSQAGDPIHTYGEVILPRKLDLYEHYVHNQTFAGDIAILWRTVCSVISG